MSATTALARVFDQHDREPDSHVSRHLADYSFRFDATAPPVADSLPASGMDWTLGQTLAELRRRNTSVDVGSRGLRVRHAHRVPQLAVAVARHERAVAVWLGLGPRAAPPLGWDDEADLLVRWLDAQPEPVGPVALRPGVSVTHWAQFRESIAGRFAEGPDAPCADGLRRDLRDLFASAGPARVLTLRRAARSRAA